MIKERKTKIIEILYSLFLCLYPILCIYKGIGSITIGDLILLIFTGISLFKSIKVHNTFYSVIIFLFYSLLSLLLNFIFSPVLANYNIFTLLFRVLKLILYFSSIYICYDKFFNKRIFCKCILLVGLLSSVFLICQYVFYYGFGKILLGRIPWLSIHLSDYSALDYNYLFSNNFRPFSFFLEPACFCQFMVVPLSLCVFEDNLKIKKIYKFLLIILFVFSMVLSTSAQGILYIAIIFFILLLKKYKGYKRIFLIFMILFFVFILFRYSDQFQFAVNRLFINQDAQSARLSTYKYIFDMDLINLFFGYGYGLTPNNEYLAGFPYVIYGTGLIGLILVLFIYFKYYFSVNNLFSKVLCLLYFIMFFGTSLFYNYMLFWFFALILFFDNAISKEECV